MALEYVCCVGHGVDGALVVATDHVHVDAACDEAGDDEFGGVTWAVGQFVCCGERGADADAEKCASLLRHGEGKPFCTAGANLETGGDLGAGDTVAGEAFDVRHCERFRFVFRMLTQFRFKVTSDTGGDWMIDVF